MHPTKNDLAADIRKKVADLLNGLLAISVDLDTQLKQAHWNVKGPHFRPLHELFDDIAEDAEDYSDLIAERIVQLGGTAFGTARVAASKSALKEYPLEITAGPAHVEAVAEAIAVFARHARKGIDETGGWGDQDTADILTEVSRGLDKWLWMVEAHLQA